MSGKGDGIANQTAILAFSRLVLYLFAFISSS